MSTTRNLLTAALLACAGNAVAASSVDLSVKGAITPSACELGLLNGGEFDLGKIAAKDLEKDQPTGLPELSTQVSVNCEAATLFAIESQDNRTGSTYLDEPNTFGLGLTNSNQKLGHIYVVTKTHVADGDSAYGIHSLDRGLTWSGGGHIKPGGFLSTYKASPAVPAPVQAYTSTMILDPYIAPSNGLTLTEEVPIDGSITLTVRYL